MMADAAAFQTAIVGIGHLLPSTARSLTDSTGVTSFVDWPANAWPPSGERVVGRVSLPERSEYVPDREWRGYGKFVALGVEAAGRALTASALLSSPDLIDCSCIVGTGKPELTTFGRFVEPIANRQVDRIKPLLFPLISRSAVAGQVCIAFGLQGYSQTVAVGEISGAHAVWRAAELIQLARSNHALAGGVETLSVLSLQAARLERVQASARHNLPEGDFMPSEGACFLAMARAEITPPDRLIARLGPSLLGRLDPGRPAGEAFVGVVETVLAKAGLMWTDIGFFTSSAWGETNWHSRIERGAWQALSSKHGHEPRMHCPRGVTGESEACASLAVVAAAAELLRDVVAEGGVRHHALAGNLDDAGNFALFTLRA